MKLDEWRLSFEITWDDPWFRLQSFSTIGLTLVAIGYGLLRLLPIGLRDGLLIYHYNLYLGIDEIHHWAWLVVIAATLLCIVLLDLLYAISLFRSDRIASRVVLMNSTAFLLLMLYGGYHLLSVNL